MNEAVPEHMPSLLFVSMFVKRSVTNIKIPLNMLNNIIIMCHHHPGSKV
jgi:hypothetical protein